MKKEFRTAYNALEKLKVPVYEHPDDNGNFSIDAEADGAERWVDYYGNPVREDPVFGVHPDLEKVLQQRGMFAEWVNPGRLAVYKV